MLPTQDCLDQGPDEIDADFYLYHWQGVTDSVDSLVNSFTAHHIHHNPRLGICCHGNYSISKKASQSRRHHVFESQISKLISSIIDSSSTTVTSFHPY